MPTVNLPALARAQGKRTNITLRPIIPTASQAADLARIIMPAAAIWGENIERILAGYDPAPLSADALTLDTTEQMSSEINAVASAFMSRLVVHITPALRDWAVRAERWHRNKWVSAVRAGTGVQLETVLTAGDVTETLSTFLARNTALITNVSDVTKAKVSDIVFRGYQERQPYREVAKQIREAVDMSRRRAQGIASDQSSKIAGALDVERQLQAGLDQFKYRHGGKIHARPWHKARDGRIFALRTGKEIAGSDVIAKGDGPTEPPYCSCRRQAYIPLMDEL